jgi:hypothetical protein
MDEHVMQEPVLQIVPDDQKHEHSPYCNVCNEDVEKYREYVVHYFDNQMNRDILMLPQEDKYRMFQMLKDYADVLEKIFHAGIPILEHILEKRWSAANANPHPGINYDHDCQIIREYDQWIEANVQKADEDVQQP